jgi:hypothetical protein
VHRVALLSPLTLLALLAAGAAPAAPAAPAGRVLPRAVEFEQAVAAPLLATPGGAVAGAAGARWRTTPPLRAPHRFDLLGVRWRGSAARIEVRVQRANGSWTRWGTASDGEDRPASSSGATRAGGAVWSGDALRYQLRSSRPLPDLRVHFVAVHGGAAIPLARASRAGGRPAIVPRSQWDPGDACRPRTTPLYGRVDIAIVHHTESLGFYTPAQSADMVLAICLFHRDGNGWNDIGYNLLVDRYGMVFEGRAGGVEQPVVGAHAQGWNDVSTGVAMIGSFSVAPPPPPALHALQRTIAWKLGLAGVPATGSIVERSIGGVFNAHPRGTRVRFRRVAGHRDGDSTDCPGTALYALLPRLGTDVAALEPPSRDLLTLSPVGAPQRQGAPVALTGRLARTDGSRPRGVALVVQQRTPSGAWQGVADTRTGADGIWTAAPALTQNGTLRIVDPAAGIASPSVEVQVRAAVRARVAPVHAGARDRVRVRGTTTPAKVRVRVLVERRSASGAFVRVRWLGEPAATDGSFHASILLAGAGVYRLTVTTPADDANAAGSSRGLLVRVLRRR